MWMEPPRDTRHRCTRHTLMTILSSSRGWNSMPDALSHHLTSPAALWSSIGRILILEDHGAWWARTSLHRSRSRRADTQPEPFLALPVRLGIRPVKRCSSSIRRSLAVTSSKPNTPNQRRQDMADGDSTPDESPVFECDGCDSILLLDASMQVTLPEDVLGPTYPRLHQPGGL